MGTRSPPSPVFALALGLATVFAPGGRAELPVFEKLKALAGDWIGEEDGEKSAFLSYDVISSGSAVRERLTMGSGPTMVSIYHPSGDQLMMTHYCSNRTQSRMRSTSTPPDAGHALLEYLDATNVFLATDGLMSSLSLDFGDGTSFTQVWNAANTTDAAVEVRYRRLEGPPPEGIGHRYTLVHAARSPAFRRLAALEGSWVMKVTEGQGPNPAPRADYLLVSGGNAVMETLHVGSPYPMVTMYYQDGDRLMATHYCGSRTQPRMATRSLSGETDSLDFRLVDATNVLQGSVSFMRDLRIDFLGPDRFTQTWNQDSEQAGSAFTFDFARVAGP